MRIGDYYMSPGELAFEDALDRAAYIFREVLLDFRAKEPRGHEWLVRRAYLEDLPADVMARAYASGGSDAVSDALDDRGYPCSCCDDGLATGPQTKGWPVCAACAAKGLRA